MITRLLGIITSVVLLATGSIGQSCSIFNGDAPGSNTLIDYSNTAFHITGEHYMDAWRSGFCSYVNGGPIGSVCIATANASDTPSGKDTGLVSNYTHVGKFATAGSSQSNQGAVSAPSAAGVVVAQCPFGACNISISINLNGVLTFNVSGGSEIWKADDTYGAYCPMETLACPLIVDTAHEGFQLTDAHDGVVTDMVIPGQRRRLGWTRKGSHNAFLWLDGHLFGNYTKQPPSDNPNGFAALAVYDSNQDGVIDARDPVFPNLRLWIDSNHDGVTQPDELFTLPALGVYAISLNYKQQNYKDDNGNLFRYRSTLRDPGEDHTIYDVFLATDLGPGSAKNNTDKLNLTDSLH